MFDRIMTVECDSEIFFNETDLIGGCILLNYEDLKEYYNSIYQEIKKYNPVELKALKNRDVDFLAIYGDN